MSYLKAIEFIREEEDDDVDDRVVVDEENEVKSFLNYHLRRLKHLIYTSVNDWLTIIIQFLRVNLYFWMSVLVGYFCK